MPRPRHPVSPSQRFVTTPPPPVETERNDDGVLVLRFAIVLGTAALSIAA